MHRMSRQEKDDLEHEITDRSPANPVDCTASQQDSLDDVAPHYSYFSDKHKGWVVVNRYELNGILAGPYKIEEQALREASRRNSLAG